MEAPAARPPSKRRAVGRREIGLILLLAVAAAALLLAGLADQSAAGGLGRFDRAILLALRNPADPADPIGPAWLETMFTDLTALGGNTVLAAVTLIVVLYLVLARRPGAAAFVIGSVAGGTLLTFLLKSGFDRPRPDLVAHIVSVSTPSFPSGHAMQSAIVYLTLGALLTRIEPRRIVRIYFVAVAVCLTLVVGFSRVYLGVHWPTDVLAGWLAGSAWAVLCWAVAMRLQRSGMLTPPNG
jgi:undecaprenyl-diphosphatase